MSIFQRVVFLIIYGSITVIMTGCHPKYTLDQTQLYARKVGITNQFEILRRNNRLLPVKSQLCVITEANDSISSLSLSTVFAKGLSPYFESVITAEGVDSIHSATVLANNNNADFVIFIQLIDKSMLFKTDKLSESNEYHRLQMLIVVADATSGNVVDKIQLLATTPHFSILGRDINSLLTKPAEQIGRDLSGV